ncbi:hypothetical protein AAHC03_05239 [Spirometra sp. Aus1]
MACAFWSPLIKFARTPLLLFSFFFLALGIQEVSFSVREEEKMGSLVGVLLPKLSEFRRGGPINPVFRLIQKGHAEYFKVSPTGGRITIAHVIDREALCPSEGAPIKMGLVMPRLNGQCQLRFTVNVLPLGTAEIIDIIQVVVNILDANDNRCTFEPSDHQTVYVPEDSRTGPSFMVPLNRPSDPDADAMHRIDPRSIRLRSADELDSARFFDLHVAETSSLERPVSLHLSIARQLDYELSTSHKLIVTASDATRMAENTCTLYLAIEVIDVNDNPPRFEKKLMYLQLNENAPVGSVIYQAKATDGDKGRIFSQLIYSLGPYAEADVRRNFHVSPNNGSVILKRKLSYARINKFEIPLIVRNPTQSEAQAASKDPSKLYGTAYIMDTSLEATVHDTARLIISVIDVNDEQPVISVFTLDGHSDISIEENREVLPSDFAVVSVTDGDSGENGRVECELSENSTSRFRLTRMTNMKTSGSFDGGQETLFKLSALVAFDREESSQVPLYLLCRDLGKPRRTSEKSVLVSIRDINDNAPFFDAPTVTLRVYEDSEPSRRGQNYEVGKVTATDIDEGPNAEIKYSLIQGTENPIFKIDEKEGLITSNGHLDREQQAAYEFEVLAQDHGHPPLSSSVKVTVYVTDFNDESPVFSESDFEFEVTEGVPENHLVGVIYATDADEGKNGELKFWTLPTDLPTHYPLSEDSLQYRWRLEDEETLPYRLVPHYIAHENRYEIGVLTSGPIDREAAADHKKLNSRKIRPTEAALDFNYPTSEDFSLSKHSFFAVAEDDGTPKRSSRAKVTVKILDVNDNAPVFLFPTSSNSTVNVSFKEYAGFAFSRVVAVDPDAGNNGSVQYFLVSQKSFRQTPGETNRNSDTLKLIPSTNRQNQPFELDRRRGTLSLKHPLSEADVGQIFRLHIIASDMAASPLRTDSVLVVQVDRSEPRGEFAARTWANAGFGVFGKSISDSMINFFIIIFIVVAAFIISAVLLTAVCLVLRKPRRNITNTQIIPKSGQKSSQDFTTVAQQNGLPGALCASVSGLPVSFSSQNNYAMSGTVALMADYMPEHWASDPSTMPSSESVLYATMTPSMLHCVADRNRYLCESEAEHKHIYAYGGNNSSQSGEEPVAAVGFPDRTELHYASLGMSSGCAGTAVVSAGAGDDGLALSTSPLAQYSFPHIQNAGAACNFDSVAWVGSQELFSSRPEMNLKRESAASNDQDSGHGDSLDTAGVQNNGSVISKTLNPKMLNLSSNRHFGNFTNVSGLGPIYDNQTTTSTCMAYPDENKCTFTWSRRPSSRGGSQLPIEGKARDTLVGLGSNPEVDLLLPKNHDNCSTFI